MSKGSATISSTDDSGKSSSNFNQEYDDILRTHLHKGLDSFINQCRSQSSTSSNSRDTAKTLPVIQGLVKMSEICYQHSYCNVLWLRMLHYQAYQIMSVSGHLIECHYRFCFVLISTIYIYVTI
jgi:hypothetical protein